MSFDLNHTYLATELTKRNLVGFNIIGDETLASKIEKHIFNYPKLGKIIFQHIKQHNIDKLEEVVLGCTHYELVYDIFNKFCPNTKFIKNSKFLIEKLPVFNETDTNVVVLQSKKDINLEKKIISLIKRN
jgi:glutamate racemase